MMTKGDINTRKKGDMHMDDTFVIDSIEELIDAFEHLSWTQEDINKLRRAIDKYQYSLDVIPSDPNKR